MAAPTLTPVSTVSAITLTSTGSHSAVNGTLPYKIYSDPASALYSPEFISGAVDQVSYVYKKLGGDVLDIELTPGNVYTAYEESVLEYSYLINVHQATNILSDALGNSTGSFDQNGLIMSGALSASLGKNHVALRYPKFEYSMTRRIADGIGSEIGLNGSTQYSGSFDIKNNQQEYDLQKIFSTATNTRATGSLTVAGDVTISGLNDDTFTLVDGEGRSQIFTFDTSTEATTAGTVGISGLANGAENDVATRIAAAINDSSVYLAVTASVSAGKVTLTQENGGAIGNTTVATDGVSDVTVVNFNGGSDDFLFGEKIKNKKVIIKKVYYKTPHAMWRFYGYYGGLNVVGNLHNYGQFSDDSTFQLIPTWHNKAQALAFEDAIYTRMSHFSYELHNNKLKIFPAPYIGSPSKMWVEFSIPEDVWDNDDQATRGVNNMNTLPLGNLPYISINAIGKQWIRRFALAVSKEMLGQVRSKFGSVPIPGDNVQLNGSDLITQAKDEQEKLRTELKETLAELTYAKLAESDGAMLESSQKTLNTVPNYIFVG